MNDRFKDICLCSGSSDRKKESDRLVTCKSVHSSLAVSLDIAHQLMVDVMTGVENLILRNRVQNLFPIETIQRPVSEI